MGSIIDKINKAANLARNMGPRYVAFRAGYAFKKKLGLLKTQFPVDPPLQSFTSLQEWKKQSVKFFFKSKQDLKTPVSADLVLKEQAEKIMQGIHLFFSSLEYDLGKDFDWVTNPETGFKYDIGKHWSEINDYSREAGDIKFVWEKSRFSFLYTLIRYDYHFKKDLSSFVFSEIESWIDANPINRGPNYKCSQEISLRILNWTFALHYYKESCTLTSAIFNKIINSIYWQAKHVYDNINFSRIAVRNNHAITETLTLYIVGLLYPFFTEASTWKKDGKRWFEAEIEYQIYPDGTFLQFSMNYHRVVIQLLTWAFALAKANGETFNEIVYDRGKASVKFLAACMNETNGYLPNYGANDGALFFPLNQNCFRDYRPQLEALSFLLGNELALGSYEDKYWYGLKPGTTGIKTYSNIGVLSFKDSGYYLLREENSMTFIRCGNHKDRPSQADNLHVDIWVDNENILRDSGSYKYNASDEEMSYFFGTASHNTIMLGKHDQMLKGGRFIWYHWSGPASGNWKEEHDYYEFTGSVEAFKQVGKSIFHSRRVRKYKNRLHWEIFDEVDSSVQLPITQIWNPNETFQTRFLITANDRSGRNLTASNKNAWYSGYYGRKEPAGQILFKSQDRYIHTTIKQKRADNS